MELTEIRKSASDRLALVNAKRHELGEDKDALAKVYHAAYKVLHELRDKLPRECEDYQDIYETFSGVLELVAARMKSETGYVICPKCYGANGKYYHQVHYPNGRSKVVELACATCSDSVFSERIGRGYYKPQRGVSRYQRLGRGIGAE